MASVSRKFTGLFVSFGYEEKKININVKQKTIRTEKKTLRPCDCPDRFTAEQLGTQGIAINDSSITVEPSVVILKIDNTTIKIPMSIFKQMAKWYLEPQETLPEKVWTTEDHKGVPKGSCIHVKSETKTTYTGIWSSSGGSCEVTVQKKFCSKTSSLQDLLSKAKKLKKGDVYP